jgi:Uma2 family endonuclease
MTDASMSVAFDRRPLRISVSRYRKMAECGVLTEQDRVELIDGEILEMAPIGPPHSGSLNWLTRLFVLALRDAAVVAVGASLELGEYSEPQPDLMLLTARADCYGGKMARPADVLLLLEVSDSSLRFDAGPKRALYARHGIPEYWIVDVRGRRLIAHRDPRGAEYSRISEHGAGETVAPLAFPGVGVAVGELLACSG